MAFRITIFISNAQSKETADFYVEYTGAKVVKENIQTRWEQKLSPELAGWSSM